MKAPRIFLSLLVCFLAMAAMAKSNVFKVDLWNGSLPNDNGVVGDSAVIHVYLPDEKLATGRAVVICPGGAYQSLAFTKEGIDWGEWFNNMGVAAIVLRYRMPHGNRDVPVSDAECAIRTVRKNAKNWRINASDVGIMGFSAGGHLASTIATHSKGDAKPDFQILFYPVITMDPAFTHRVSHDNLLGKDAKKKEEREYCNDLHVTRATPRAFIALSDDDAVVLPINGVNYYVELYRHDVPATLHVYPAGGHGWGMQPSFRHHTEMLLDLAAWLRSF